MHSYTIKIYSRRWSYYCIFFFTIIHSLSLPMPGSSNGVTSNTNCSPSARVVMGSSPRKSANWETAEDLKVETSNLSNYQSNKPTLHFSLNWAQQPGGGPGNEVEPHCSEGGNHSSVEDLKALIKPKQPLTIVLANSVATKPKQQGSFFFFFEGLYF